MVVNACSADIVIICDWNTLERKWLGITREKATKDQDAASRFGMFLYNRRKQADLDLVTALFKT